MLFGDLSRSPMSVCFDGIHLLFPGRGRWSDPQYDVIRRAMLFSVDGLVSAVFLASDKTLRVFSSLSLSMACILF